MFPAMVHSSIITIVTNSRGHINNKKAKERKKTIFKDDNISDYILFFPVTFPFVLMYFFPFFFNNSVSCLAKASYCRHLL